MTGKSSEEEILEQVIELFRDNYQKARLLHLRHEALTGERSVQTLVNFRDTLDHLGRVFIAVDNEEYERADEELTQAEDHLERIIYDGSKRPLEATISYLKNNRLPSILYKLAFIDVPDNEEFERRMRRIREIYFEGRTNRSEQSFEKANELAEELKNETPPKSEVYYRLVILSGVIVTLIVAGNRLLP